MSMNISHSKFNGKEREADDWRNDNRQTGTSLERLCTKINGQSSKGSGRGGGRGGGSGGRTG